MSYRFHIKTCFLFLLLFFPLVGNSSGWNDYSLDLGEGFRIIRANSFDKGLDGPNQIHIFHRNYPKIGPLVGYYKDPNYIFVKTIGWKYRNLFEGDTFKEGDPSKEYYFIVNILDSSINGPLIGQQFNIEANNIGFSSIDWMDSKNPNFWTPLIGTLMFLAISLPILYVKYWFYTLPISAVLIFLISAWNRKRHNEKSKAETQMRFFGR